MKVGLPLLLALTASGAAAMALGPAAGSVARYVIAGGGGRSSSATRVVHGTVGQAVVGVVTGPAFRLGAGFWAAPRAGAPPTPGTVQTPSPTAGTGTSSPTAGTGTSSPAATGTTTATVTPGGEGRWTVNNTSDTDDGACDAAHCALREALAEANRHSGPDAIGFAIPTGAAGCDASGVCTIRLTVRLPELADARTTIDGFTQPGARANTAAFGRPIDAAPRIVLDGSGLGEGSRYSPGLDLRTAGNVIRGLVIHSFYTGIEVLDASDNRIEGNFVGVDASGLSAPGNRCSGIALAGLEGGVGSARNVIGGPAPAARNLIAGNGCDGVAISPSGANLVQGNYLGTDATGERALPNAVAGVRMLGSTGNRIGGAVDGEANLIAFNRVAGVIVSAPVGPAGRNTISRNRIHGNIGPGIYLEGGANGGVAPPEIRSATATRATGTACGGCTVEVFSDDEDEGARFEGVVSAGGGGDWALDRPGGFGGPNLTATSTDRDGNTSAFAAPVALPRPSPTVTPSRAATPGIPGTPGTPGGPATGTPPWTPGATPAVGAGAYLPWAGRRAPGQ